MILVSLELSNYKQYAGYQRIEFPSEGAVAIIGNNGAGKTTLFEAIEWCLYSPREIPSESLITRGGISEPAVRLVLEDPRDGARYVVERRRKRRGVEAEVYNEARPEAPLVTGARDVTDFISRRLIGLGHRAFVSTFFTRQKELSFFGELRETDRRREVARLLGFETIRVAQGLLGDERTVARNDATALGRQFEEESRDRDFAAERASLADDLQRAEETVAAGLAYQAQAAATQLAARRHREDLAQQGRDDAALAQRIIALEGQLSARQAELTAACDNLDELSRQSAQRDALCPVAATEPAHLRDLRELERDRERFVAAESHRRAIERADAVLAAAPKRFTLIMAAVPGGGAVLPEWRIAVELPSAVDNAIGHLLGRVAGLDAAAARNGARQIEAAFQATLAVAERSRLSEQAHASWTQLAGDRDRLLREGDPVAEYQAAASARDAAAERKTEALQQGTYLKQQIADREAAMTAILAAAAAPHCPTCLRPLSPAAAELALGPLREQITGLRAEKAGASGRYKAAQRDLDAAAIAIETADSRRGTLRELDGQLASAQRFLRQREADLAAASRDADAAVRAADLRVTPTADDVTAAMTRAETTMALVAQAPALRQLGDALGAAAAERTAAGTALGALGDTTYDAARHERVRAAHNAALDAVARVAQIEQALAKRPTFEAQRRTAEQAIAATGAELKATQQRRAELGFAQAALDAAQAAEDEAGAALRAAEQRLGQAQFDAAQATNRQQNLLADQERIANLDRKAQARRREWDDLERMYKEFARFDQYVSQLVTPQLADYTGELLAEVTDRAYDQAYFDENYGLHIYDGPEAFPISHFSGGERDVAALCARLALSRFIGAQALHPPRFLVLDEVFGSLDADRRHHLMQALLQLAGADGPFRQLFIISHVDDVRTSPALDEVWRIREQGGASVFENVSRTGAVEEF